VTQDTLARHCYKDYISKTQATLPLWLKLGDCLDLPGGWSYAGRHVLKLRRRLVPVAVAWLLLHVSVVAGSTVALLASGTSKSALVCTCADGADHGSSCPMHHGPADSTRCHFQGAQDDVGLALIAVTGSFTLPVTEVATHTDAPSPGPIGYHSPFPADWSAPPDSPPPRR
jgi:hypothetical protein